MPITTPPRAAGRFHLAIPVDDLKAAAAFYGDVMGCRRGREAEHWIDWDFFGHQLVTHEIAGSRPKAGDNPVDGKSVPVPHFGVILDRTDWQDLADRLTAAGCGFVIEPYLRFEGTAGEQGTLFLLDPCGNALEFKCFADDAMVFAPFDAASGT
jgi:uncharacterized protein